MQARAAREDEDDARRCGMKTMAVEFGLGSQKNIFIHSSLYFIVREHILYIS